jgi:hypothetical protein
MHPMRPMRFVLSIVLAATLLPAATAFAVTAPEIVSLTKAGVSEPIILALIERDKTIFSITPEQLVTLQKEGVSDAVILAMLKSGRQEPQPQPAPAPPPIAPQYEPSEPTVVVIGHGPDRPNTTDAYNRYNGAAPYPAPYVVPYFVPVPYAVPVRVPRSHHPVQEFTVPVQPLDSRFLSIAPPALATTPPEVNGIFFTSPSARGIFVSR